LLHGQIWSSSVEFENSFTEPGMVFLLDNAPTGNFNQFLFPSGKNYFLPWRFISTACTVDYVSGKNYKYERFMVNVDGAQYYVAMRNEYYTFGEELSESEMNDLCTWINRNATNVRVPVSTIKTNLNQDASTYTTNKASLEAAKGGVAGLTKQLNIAKASKIDFDGQMQTLKTQLTQQNKLIGEKQLLLETLIGNSKTTTQNMNSINSEDKALDLQIKSMETQITSGSANSGDFQTKLTMSQDKFVADIAKLKTLAPQQAAVSAADAASAALLTQNNPEVVNTKLTKITP
jgi:hypothetical protein